ncbi:hypothetical protein BZG24_29345, partial [Escherichia coli]|nr:hypothetical protein [Escherichia coli]
MSDTRAQAQGTAYGKESGSPIYLLRGKMVLPDGLAEDGLLAWTDSTILYAGRPEGLPASIRRDAVT